MKVLSVLTYYAPHWTGLTAHAVRLAEGLAARGHEVTVLTTRHAKELPKEDVVNGVRVIRLETVGRLSRGMIAPAFPLAAWRLVSSHDVVQIHTPLPEAPLVAAFARALDRPCVMTHHGDLVLPPGAFHRVLEAAGFAVLSAAGALSDAVTTYSRDYAESSRLLVRFASKLHAIRPPVELPEPDRAAAAAWRAELGLTGKPVIGFAGRWVAEKGFDILLRALPLVQRELPGAHLVYAGEPNVVYERTFERCRPLLDAVRGDVTLLGLLRDPRKMAQFYALCDLFALPSRSDMLALVQVESLLAGTPVVASDIPGARVVVKETGAGRLVTPEDPRALADALVAAYRERARLAPDVDRVRARWSPEESVSRNEELLGRVIAERAGRPARAPVRVPRRDRRVDRLLASEADMAYRRRARLLLEDLAPKDGERILDCGAGIGFYLKAISTLAKVAPVGVDLDLGKLGRAARAAPTARVASADAVRLPFASGSFDKVLASEVLEHVADEGRALAELRRVLAPGGLLALSVPDAAYPFLWDPINRVWTALGGRPFRRGPLVGIWTDHVRLYRAEDLARAVAEAGFEVLSVAEATHACLPFHHFLLYGVGKPLVERGLLPESLRRRVDRMSDAAPAAGAGGAAGLLLKLLEAHDARNDRAETAAARTFVNVVLLARRPG